MPLNPLYQRLVEGEASTLSTVELLSIFLGEKRGSHCSETLAQRLLAQVGSLTALLRAEPLWLKQQPGMGLVQCAKFQAILEIIQRGSREDLEEKSIFSSPFAVKNYLLAFFQSATREMFIVLLLDNKHRLLKTKTLFQGSINRTMVYPREVVKTALLHNASALILAHNHPAGDPEPSADDYMLTEEIRDACNLLDLRLLDHIVVGKNKIFSFARQGWLPSVHSPRL